MYSFGKSFIRTALLFVLAASAVAPGYGRGRLQSGGAVLAGGDPPLTAELSDQIREVFEWLLEAKLTPVQRRRFQQLLVADWSAGPGKSNEVYLGFLKLRSQLADATPEQRDAARAQIGPEFVRALYRPPVDAMSRLLIEVHEAEQGKLNQVSGGPPTPRQPQDAGGGARASGGLPSELTGRWVATRGSGSMFYDPNSGSYGAPNGTADSYTFFADGRYEHALLVQNSLYNCTIRIFKREVGRAAADGDALTLTPGPGTFEYQDNCRPRLNSKKVTHEDGQRWRWRVVRDGEGLKLCVRDQDGDSACYTRR